MPETPEAKVARLQAELEEATKEANVDPRTKVGVSPFLQKKEEKNPIAVLGSQAAFAILFIVLAATAVLPEEQLAPIRAFLPQPPPK